MQKKVEKKVLAYCEKHHMFHQGDTVVVGVSGGADSVCLLLVLLSLQKKWDLKLQVVHMNHGIRPEAGEDAAYVRRLCEKHNLPFTLVEKDIPGLAEELGCSEEEAGRRARYECFEQALQKAGVNAACGKIAVAHHAGDRAETMLFHLFRGTGLTGLRGICPVRDRIVRPLLCLERAEIEAYLTACEMTFCHDNTNDSDDYTRNKIRHHILRYAEEEIVQGCVGNMMRTADILAETEDYIEEQVSVAMEACVRVEAPDSTATKDCVRDDVPDREGGQKARYAYCVDVQQYLKWHRVVQKRLLLALLKELSPQHKDMGAVHVEALLSLFLQEGNRCVHLPYGIRGNREYGFVLLERADSTHCEQCLEYILPEETLAGGTEYALLIDGRQWIFSVTIAPAEGINCKDIPQNQYTKWFDYDKIKERLAVRTRKEGDYLTIRSGCELRHKKLKDYMIDEKIPSRQRDDMPLLAEGAHVLWLAGYRISEYYKVDAGTKRILQVSCEPDNG